jgi:proteasome lid subunit RPN8/RPN11
MLDLGCDAYDALVDHACEGAPNEICGVLGGLRDDDTSSVLSVHPAENAADTPRTEYSIDPEEQLALIEAIEADGDDVVGFYHSHPAGPPAPSETDAARATWPGLSYVIVVLDGRHPYVGSWRLDGDTETFEQEIVRRR